MTIKPPYTQEKTGEIIIDTVLDALRTTTIIMGEDLAKHLGVGYRELNSAWKLLTGSTLRQFILHWRIHQARELLAQAGYMWDDTKQKCHIPAPVLQQVAEKCGWRNYRRLRDRLRSQL